MKLSTLAICICLVVSSLMFSYAQDNEILNTSREKLDKDFLGLYLGCSFNEFQAQLKQSTISMTFRNQKFIDGATDYYYYGNHRLNGAKGTTFSFWNGKLFRVDVFFESEEAKKVYDALKVKMEDKYGKMRDEIKFLGEKCYMTSDGMWFKIEYEKKPFETGTVELVCVHMGLADAKAAKELEKKSKDLGDL